MLTPSCGPAASLAVVEGLVRPVVTQEQVVPELGLVKTQYMRFLMFHNLTESFLLGVGVHTSDV